MTSAEIITIGTEILLGEIVDTNSAYLTRHLRDLNIDVYRTSTIGDNTQRIADIIREALGRTQIIITTGGLGPTIDDPTREAVALAFNIPTEFQPDLWEQIVERMGRFGRIPTENQKRQAYIPKGAVPVKNDVGTAPAFIVEYNNQCVISLPGVPREMEYLAENAVFPYLQKHFSLKGIIKARVLHTSGMGEGAIDEQIGDLELLSNPTVGLAAHYGVVDIRITAKSDDPDTANQLISDMEHTIRQKLGRVIFGVDDETLENVVINMVGQKGWKLAILEINSGGELTKLLSNTGSSFFVSGKILPVQEPGKKLEDILAEELIIQGADVGIALVARPAAGRSEAEIVLITPEQRTTHIRGYGGHPKNVPTWGANSALDLLRSVIS